jgi:RNA polymerase primary sigma factor
MDRPLLDLTDPAVRRMIKLAKRRGYITHEELDQVLPPDEFSPEQIEDVLGQLSELGINVVGGGDDVQDRYRNLARELRNFASGQRGQGRELLENAATVLDGEAGDCWSPYRSGSWV